jgi:glutamate N-acetyltransferase / amino-acid N-acetyltransferase
MAVNLAPPAAPLAVPGVRAGAASAGIRRAGRLDLALLELAPGSRAAAVFTRNAFAAAPVQLARAHLAAAAPRYLLINAGNANAATGAPGLEAARACCAALAARAGCAIEQVLPFSTGVIGEPLPVERLTTALPAALADLAPDGWTRAMQAIMTTDTVPKGHAVRVRMPDGDLTVTGIAKGSGMIRPDMATMLAFIATDAALSTGALDAHLRTAVARSFNRITVDGDTSTNDACVLVATGVRSGAVDAAAFQDALDAVCTTLAQAIVRDGEGATRFVTVAVRGGRDGEECRRVAYAIAHSPLVKTALFAADPNWGRILAAIGNAGIEGLDPQRVAVSLDEVCVVAGGARAERYREEDGQRVLDRPEYTIAVDLGRGAAADTVWTCDLSHEYVRINAEYRS